MGNLKKRTGKFNYIKMERFLYDKSKPNNYNIDIYAKSKINNHNT